MGQHTDSPVKVEDVAVSEYTERSPTERHGVEVVLGGREGGRRDRREREGEGGRGMKRSEKEKEKEEGVIGYLRGFSFLIVCTSDNK